MRNNSGRAIASIAVMVGTTLISRFTHTACFPIAGMLIGLFIIWFNADRE